VEDVRCPSCAALVTPEAAWCSLCYHDLRPPAPEPDPAPEADLVPVRLDALDALALQPAALAGAPARRGRHARPEPAAGPGLSHTAQPSGPEAQLSGLDAVAEAKAAELLAALKAQSALSPGVGSLVGRMGSTGAKVGVMVGGVVLVTVLTFALMALVGSFL
jgi:hypothetical protein